MSYQNVEVDVNARSSGEEVYVTHANGMRKLSTEARTSRDAFRTARGEVFGYRMALMGMNASLSTANVLFELAGVKNETLRKVMIGLNAALAVANTALLLKSVLEMRAASAGWAHAIANIAASGWLAPVLLAIVAAAVAGAIGIQSSTHKMAYGGEGTVSSPTLFLAGEAGPEAYSFVPLKSGGGGGSGMYIGRVDVTVVSNNPDLVGAAWAELVRKLREAGR